MLIELLLVCVCREARPLDQNDIENVLILINYSEGPHWIMIKYSTGSHQRHVADGYTLICKFIFKFGQ